MDDDDQERGQRLLLGKGALLAHRLARPLGAEMDELRQSAFPEGMPSHRINAAPGSELGPAREAANC